MGTNINEEKRSVPEELNCRAGDNVGGKYYCSDSAFEPHC